MQVIALFVTFAFIFLVIGFVCFHFFAIQVCLASYDMYDSGKKLRQKIFNSSVYVMNKKEKTTIIKNKIIEVESFVLFYLLISIGFYLMAKMPNQIGVVVACLSSIIPGLIAFTIALFTKDMGIFANKN